MVPGTNVKRKLVEGCRFLHGKHARVEQVHVLLSPRSCSSRSADGDEGVRFVLHALNSLELEHDRDCLEKVARRRRIWTGMKHVVLVARRG